MNSNSVLYNLATIRELLLASFTSETLRRFCLDRSVYRPIVAEFAPGHGLADMVDKVLDYCRTQLLWEELLEDVKRVNPRQYHRYEPQLRNPPHQPRPSTEQPVDPIREESLIDSSAIAARVVSVLVAYLTSSEVGLSATEARQTWERALRIEQAVKARFNEEQDSFPLEVLQRFEEMPEKRKAAMKEVLEEVLERDRRFAQQLNTLMKGPEEGGSEAITQQVMVSGQARTGDITQIGKVQGSVDLSGKR